MYNTYFSSALLTFRTKAPLSFSFNDYSNLLNERFDKNPSSPLRCLCCNCCSCCSSSSFPSNRVLINPNLFYGLRQSTLIHWSPCRRLFFGARDPYCYRVPNCGLDHSCFDICCEKSGSGGIERRRKDRIGRLNLNQRYCLSSPDDAEAVISFLSEEVSEEYIGDRAQNGSFRKKVEIERRSNYAGDYWNAKKKNERLSQFETAKSKSEGFRRKEELEERRRREEVRDFRRKEEWKEYRSKEERSENEERRTGSRGETHRGRRPSSSCSSNYSLYAGEYRSDKEAQDENVGLLEASSSGYSRNSRSRRANFKEKEEDFETQADVEQGEYMEQRTSTRRTGADWELRKKTEKKLTEVEETESQRESSRLHSKIATTSRSDHGELYSSDKQLGDEQGKITMAANFDEGRRKHYIWKGDQEVTDISTKRSSQYQTQLIGREEDLKEGANLANEKRRRYHETIDTSTGMENRSNNQQTSQISETGNVVKRDTKFPSLSESRMKIREEDVALRSSWEASEKRLQAFKQITDQFDSRSASQHSSKISKINDSDSRKTSILQSENGIKNQEASASFLSHSAGVTNEQRSHADQKVDLRIQSGKGSQDLTNKAVNVTNVSIRNSTDIKRVNYTQVTSERMTDQGSEHVSSVNPIQEAREIDNQINESIAAVKSRDEAYKATEVSCFQEQNSQEASRSHAYLDMVSQVHSQLINVEEGGYRSSSPTMMPPSRQMLDQGSFYVNPVSGVETLEVPGATSESNSSGICTHSEGRTPISPNKPYRRDGRQEMYGEPLDILSLGDTMVSAQRLEESSKKFIGEYIDMAWNEALASEMSDANLEYEGEKDKKKIPSQSGSESSPLKKLDSMRLSGGSGAKGLSDEIWDVTDTSALEPSKTGAPEDSATIKNTVARRSGRSLWAIISDVVQLRWGSHFETRKSSKISGGKSSSNDSVSSEAWFSGHEPEETSDKNVKKERSMPKEAFFSHRQQLVRPMPGQGEVSDTHSSKSIKRQLETNAPSPSTTYISGSTSKGVLSPAEEENLVWGQERKSFEGTRSLDGKNSHVSPPSTDAGESSVLPLPSSSMITLTAEEFYGRGVSIGEEMEMKEQPFVGKPVEALSSEEKDRELKQRKLQRNKQVVKDKFDEWEETYTHESEQQRIDEMFMREALLEAKKAGDMWEVPVGAVLVQHGKIIARGYNLVEELRDSTAHAEIICIREASNQLRSWRLAESTLYVTLEPCAMCAGAILQARIDTLVWGAPNKLLGADGSWIRLFPNSKGGNDTEVRGDEPSAPPHPFHPKMTIRRGILQSECADVMQQFFQLRRRKKAKNKDTPSQPSLPIASHQSKFLRKMHDIFHAFLCL